MNIENYVRTKAIEAKKASRFMSILDTLTKNQILLKIADDLEKNMELIIKENQKDIDYGLENNLSESLIDRIKLNKKRILEMTNSIRDLVKLKDPIGDTVKMWKIENGLQIGQIRVPLGVIGMIYEARPNVTVDAATLAIKSGNCIVLRGGKEAINSNKALSNIIINAAENAGLPKGSIQFIDIIDREAVNILMKQNNYIDVLIPRGGKGLIRTVVENSTIPVIETGTGNCHVFVDSTADMQMAVNIIINGKTQRPAVCNAIETVLIHKDIAKDFLPILCNELKSYNVEIRGCEVTNQYVENISLAIEKDYATEFLDLIIAIKVVKDFDEAVEHIFKYSTKHSEVIVTNDYTNSQKFLQQIDAAAVYVNASSRFTDGSQFGFGSEIGISTQKLHARGPMGVEHLTTIKSVIYGQGQIRN